MAPASGASFTGSPRGDKREVARAGEAARGEEGGGTRTHPPHLFLRGVAQWLVAPGLPAAFHMLRDGNAPTGDSAPPNK